MRFLKVALNFMDGHGEDQGQGQQLYKAHLQALPEDEQCGLLCGTDS